MGKRKINPWMISTLVLLALILGTTVFFIVRVTSIREPEMVSRVEENKNVNTIAKIETNKKEINAIINRELDKKQNGKMDYSFYLDKEAVFEGKIKVFQVEVPVYLYFTPKKLENGNINLKVKRLSAGTLDLPVSTVLSFFKGNVSLPPYVEIDSKKEEATIRLDKIKLTQGMKVKATMIDLVNDKFIFSINVKE